MAVTCYNAGDAHAELLRVTLYLALERLRRGKREPPLLFLRGGGRHRDGT